MSRKDTYEAILNNLDIAVNDLVAGSDKVNFGDFRLQLTHLVIDSVRFSPFATLVQMVRTRVVNLTWPDGVSSEHPDTVKLRKLRAKLDKLSLDAYTDNNPELGEKLEQLARDL